MKQSNVRESALEVLLKIEKDQAYSHLLLNETIKRTNLKEKDIPLLTEMVYGTIQYQMRLDYYISTFSKRPLEKLEDWVVILLRLTLYQMVFLDRIPDHAAIHEAVQIAKKRGHQGIAGMVNGILRSVQRNGVPKVSEIKDALERVAVETSHPVWLISRWSEQYGPEQAKKIAAANLQHPVHTVRVNLSKTSVEEVMNSLHQEGIEATRSENIPESLVISRGSVINTKGYKEGAMTIQDEGSMLVAYALAPEEGERILDACAAPGGKTTHLSEKMNSTGELVALDIHEHKVGLIRKQGERLGLTNIAAKALDARKAGEYFTKESFDKILVDAPCSGLGVIQRKPDLKWSKKQEDIHYLAKIQGDILWSVWPLLKPGGRLVYSTCTIDRKENNQVITEFIHAQENATLDKQLLDRLPLAFHDCQGAEEGMIQLFPGEKGTDGFFHISSH
ncbi:MAG: 16S rRNA (cytosine(967)-C(5))-methyltransferase RsmB [Bacillus sp. (in: Bacteria)]|nr:16S rRNA (cytosine(967)-C(5))-methyltransferase RsmB [Bacillus sp. (in: firmicutes)]